MFIAWPWSAHPAPVPFRFVDPVSGRWVRARYKTERHELKQRYAQWEITGAPEIRRGGDGMSGTFNPYR